MSFIPIQIYDRRREVFDLVVSWLAVTFAFGLRYLYLHAMWMLGGVALATLTGFILHELAHRYVARSYGLYASYRAWYPGLLMAILIAILTRGYFVFAAPGAVVIPVLPFIDRRVIERISIAGPLTNVFISIVCTALLITLPLPPTYYQILEVVGYINAFLALFNLLPIPPLDGSKAITNLRLYIPTLLTAVILLTMYFLELV